MRIPVPVNYAERSCYESYRHPGMDRCWKAFTVLFAVNHLNHFALAAGLPVSLAQALPIQFLIQWIRTIEHALRSYDHSVASSEPLSLPPQSGMITQQETNMAAAAEDIGVDNGKLEEFANQVMGDVGGAFAILLAYIGDQTGVFRSLRDEGSAKVDVCVANSYFAARIQ